jgi:hypothetical protein
MTRLVAVAVAALLAITSLASAKGETSKVTITGGRLAAPVEIADSQVLGAFNVWSGPGVTANNVPQAEGFIVDWSAGAVSQPPPGVPEYELEFAVHERDSINGHTVVYVVRYAAAPTGPGYVYLPGPGDDHYALNTRSIYRQREGQWYRATKAWDDVMRSALSRSR